ncbi:MAG: YihY/virulence factor BrkB family protein [Aeromicrobium sp.]|uniref:YihY/virulence factor BrkB family protein n=1 Tax=Aeromicrobium sp. TaxID=1871063 RepID=UPI0039E4002A
MHALKARLRTTWKLASERNASLLAAGVAFYVFLALFPSMIAGILVYGLLIDPATLARQSESLARYLPEDAASVVTGQMETLAATSHSSLSIGFAASVTLALYSASGGMDHLMTAVNAMLGNPRTLGFVRQRAIALALTVGAVLFLLIAISVMAVLPVVIDRWIDPLWLRFVLDLGRFALLALSIAIGFGLVVHWSTDPAAGHVVPRLLSPGIGGAGVAWLLISVGFSFYVSRFGNYGQTYGALAGVVVLQLWLWAGLFALLFGAAYEAVRLGDRPTDPDTP